jgi:hypothetical protein
VKGCFYLLYAFLQSVNVAFGWSTFLCSITKEAVSEYFFYQWPWFLPVVEFTSDIVGGTVRTGLARCKVAFDLFSSTKVTVVMVIRKESQLSLTRFSYKPYLLTLKTAGQRDLPGSSDP